MTPWGSFERMGEPTVFAAIVAVAIAMALVVALRSWWVGRRLAALESERDDGRGLALLQQEIDGLRDQVARAIRANGRSVNEQLAQMSSTVDKRLHQGVELTQQAHRALGERLDNTTRVVSAVERSLGGLEEANRRIFEVGRDIASLQEILRPPKLRGGLGEMLLEDLLRQILPAEHLAFQYAFASGQRVDAVIRLEAGLVPVDAKFPLENFRRILDGEDDAARARARRAFVADVRRHIDAIAERYIRPQEGTLEFALMYVPAENVYYEIIVKDELTAAAHISDYALKRRVVPVSPGSFYAYLQAIAVGLRGLRIEKRAADIMGQLSVMRDEISRLRDAHRVVGRHLGNAAATLAAAERNSERLEAHLVALAGDDEKPPVAATPNAASVNEAAAE